MTLSALVYNQSALQDTKQSMLQKSRPVDTIGDRLFRQKQILQNIRDKVIAVKITVVYIDWYVNEYSNSINTRSLVYKLFQFVVVPGISRNQKNPEVIKKKGTATRATIRVRIKSPVALKEANGEVWIVIIKIAAIRRKKSMPV